MTRPPRLALLLLSLAACRSGRAVEVGALATEAPTTQRPEAPTVDARPDAAPVSAPPDGDDRSACAADGDCVLTASCDCLQCGAHPRSLHVEACPTVCERDACSVRRARCDPATRRCVAAPMEPAPTACDAPCERDEACAAVTPPDCGPCVAVARDRRSERACAAWGCRATVCDTSAWRARCDAQTRRCVLVEAAPR